VTLGDLKLSAEHLWLIVFGPGYGESILVVLPGSHWIAIDSLRCQDEDRDVNPALELLVANEAHLSMVALTHPHNDHVQGLTDLLDRRLPDSPVGCVAPYLRRDGRWQIDPDASKVRDGGAADTALNRIEDIWAEEPKSEWPLLAGSTRSVEKAEVEVLFPDQIPPKKPRNPNLLSAPMMLRWQSCHVLLGADLLSTKWKTVERKYAKQSELKLSHALKASHHGSGRSQHHVAIGAPPPKNRVCLLTPFNRNSKLPDYGDGEGMDRLLECHERVGVTSVPAKGRGKESHRVDLLPHHSGFGSIDLEHEDLSASPREAWIAIGFDADGTEVARHSGDAAGIVV